MVLFEPWAGFAGLLGRMLSFDMAGQTVVGGIAGAIVAVELAKRAVGIRENTGDAWAVAVPLALGIGRIGCWFNGCCYGRPPHPAQLYDAALCLGIAGWLWLSRTRGLPKGHLWRRFLVSYALGRFALEFVRADNGHRLGPLTLVQWICVAAAIGYGTVLVIGEEEPVTPAART